MHHLKNLLVDRQDKKDEITKVKKEVDKYIKRNNNRNCSIKPVPLIKCRLEKVKREYNVR